MSAEVKVENGEVKMEEQAEAPAAATQEGEGEATPAAGDTAASGKKPHPVGRTIIVKNLPHTMLFTYGEELKEKFSKYGEIGYIKLGGITVVHDTVVPTLTAFVNFVSPESSDKALEGEAGAEINGHTVELQILRSNELTVIANNIPCSMTEDCIRNLFTPCGDIKKIIKIPARPTAFIEFDNEESVKKALTLSDNLCINSLDISLHKYGADPLKTDRKRVPKPKIKKPPVPAVPVRTFPSRGSSRGLPRGRSSMSMGRGAMRGISRPPPQPWGGQQNMWGGGGGGGQYGPWNGAPPRQFNNNWGNDNFANSNDGPRGFKRRKQNEWWQY